MFEIAWGSVLSKIITQSWSREYQEFIILTDTESLSSVILYIGFIFVHLIKWKEKSVYMVGFSLYTSQDASKM